MFGSALNNRRQSKHCKTLELICYNQTDAVTGRGDGVTVAAGCTIDVINVF